MLGQLPRSRFVLRGDDEIGGDRALARSGEIGGRDRGQLPNSRLGSPVAQPRRSFCRDLRPLVRPVTPSHTACFQQLRNPGHPKNLTLRVTLGVGGPHGGLPFDLQPLALTCSILKGGPQGQARRARKIRNKRNLEQPARNQWVATGLQYGGAAGSARPDRSLHRDTRRPRPKSHSAGLGGRFAETCSRWP